MKDAPYDSLLFITTAEIYQESKVYKRWYLSKT
jgi:hypothetical protein